MALTGAPLIFVLFTVTLVALAWSALAVPSRRSVGAVLRRLTAQVVVSGLVVLSVAAVLNRQNEWYSSWSDLLGRPSAVVSASGGGPAPRSTGWKPTTVNATAPAVSATAPAVIGKAQPPLPSPGQRFQTFTVTGAASGLTGTVLVSLPAGYEDPANAGRTYPVIEALHGFPGSPNEWRDGGIHLVDALDRLEAQRGIRDTVVIAPQIEFPAGADTECVNGSSGQPQVETWLARDVPGAMAARLRIAQGPQSWATMGFSAGGWCAAMLTMLHPDVYGSGVVLGGYMSPVFGRGYVPFQASDPADRRYDLISLASSAPPPAALWLQTSKADPLSYSSSAALLRAARAPLSVQSQVEVDAGHRITVWAAAVPPALSWLASTAPGFRP
jgi:pimeloyl-ACP methyl ester carboxylesterase